MGLGKEADCVGSGGKKKKPLFLGKLFVITFDW